MSKEHVVSTHIEKTAGTSLEAWFIKVYGADRVLLYSPATDTFLRGSDVPISNPATDYVKRLFSLTPLMAIASEVYKKYKSHSGRNHITLENLPLDFDVVHGHFDPARFIEHLNDPFTSIVLRDPLGRAVSQFIHWRRRHGRTNHKINIPFDPEISFRDFATLPEMTNFQAKAMGGMSVTDFDLVGITENMGQFTNEYFRRRGLPGDPPAFPDFNRTLMVPALSDLGVDNEFRAVFHEINSQDYEIYAQASKALDG